MTQWQLVLLGFALARFVTDSWALAKTLFYRSMIKAQQRPRCWLHPDGCPSQMPSAWRV